MAISKTIELRNNFNEVSIFNDTYIKVLACNAAKDYTSFEVGFFKSQNGEFLQSKTYSLDWDLDGPNVIKQAYIYLKTLQEFSGAIDC